MYFSVQCKAKGLFLRGCKEPLVGDVLRRHDDVVVLKRDHAQESKPVLAHEKIYLELVDLRERTVREPTFVPLHQHCIVPPFIRVQILWSVRVAQYWLPKFLR